MDHPINNPDSGPAHNRPHIPTLILSGALTVLLTILTQGDVMAMPTSAAPKPSKEMESLYKKSSGMNARQLYDKGRETLEAAHPDSAIIYYSLLLERLNDHMPKTPEDRNMLPQVYNNIGYTYLYHLNDYVQAYTNLLYALESTEDASDRKVLPYIYLNIANVYASFNDQGKAIDYYRKAFDSQYKMKQDSPILPVIALNLFPAAYMENQTSTIEKETQELLSVNMDGNPSGEAAHAVAQGVISHREGDEREAADRFKEALRLLTSAHDADERIIHSLELLLAEALSRNKRNSDAISILKGTMESTKNAGILDQATVAANNISEYYRRLSRTDSANHYRLIHIDLKDSLMNAANYAKIRDLHSIYEISSANEEIRVLSDRDRTKTVILYLCLAGGTILLTLLAIIIRKNHMLRIRNEKLYEQSQRLLNATTMPQPKHGPDIPANTAKKTADTGDNTNDSENSQLSDTIGVPAPDEKTDAVKAEIIRIMESDGICVADFSLESLSRLLDEKSRTVSAAISNGFGMGFNQLLSEYRIKKACLMLADPTYDHLTVQSIGESLGFKSRSNFGALFKRQTGLSPGEYHSIALKKRNAQQNIKS